jgi:CDP-2,3-bis-(O-geranylgeranyl)-sn-glycerol synthase
MIVFVWKCVYFALPGVFANMAPVLFKKVNFLNHPVDFGKKWKGQPLFGSHKTFRGFFFGTLCAMVVVYIQALLFHEFGYFRGISIVPYMDINTALLGFLIGFGALLGDLVKSFFKRRIGVAPGKSWFPWDQLDALIGALLLLSIVFVPPWQMVVFLVIAVPMIHIGINHIAYYLGMKETKW